MYIYLHIYLCISSYYNVLYILFNIYIYRIYIIYKCKYIYYFYKNYGSVLVACVVACEICLLSELQQDLSFKFYFMLPNDVIYQIHNP